MEAHKNTMGYGIVMWVRNHLVAIAIIILLIGVGYLFHRLDWYNAFFLMVMNLGLGIKLHGAKTVAVAVAKSGGKKALAMTTAGVLLKRHIIDVASKFFAEHSVARYKRNVVKIIQIKMKQLRNSTIAQKLKIGFSVLMSIPGVYFVWSKILGTALQKILYALVYPLIAIFVDFIATGFSMITGFLTFILQLTLLNYVMDWMYKFRFGRMFIGGVVNIFKFFGSILDYVNEGFKLIGLDPKHKLIVYSIKFNRWLERIVTKEMNARDTIIQRRTIHINSRERFLLKREARKIVEKETITKKTKRLFNEKVLKKTCWRDRREKNLEKRDARRNLKLNLRKKYYNTI